MLTLVYSHAKTSCTIAFMMLKGNSFCWMGGMESLYSVPSMLNFGIRLLILAIRLYGICGFAMEPASYLAVS